MSKIEEQHVKIKMKCQICGKAKTINYIKDPHKFGKPDVLIQSRVNEQFQFAIYDDKLKDNTDKNRIYYKEKRIVFTVDITKRELCEECLCKCFRNLAKGKWKIEDNMFCTTTHEEHGSK